MTVHPRDLANELASIQADLPPPGSEIVAALPRSPLHLRLLEANAEALDIVFYRDAMLEAHFSPLLRAKAIYLGREQRWPDTRGLFQVRATNRRYYKLVRQTLRQWTYRRFLIFLESEPLENLILDAIGPERIELWEEGLGHYVDFHGPLYNALRGTAQAACGFYPKRILRRRQRRHRFAAVRDRFNDGSLTLGAAADPPGQFRDAVMFIGAPLIQDRMVARQRYLNALEQVICATRFPVVYYPHPREDTTPLKELVDAFGATWFEIAEPEGDVATHCRRVGYRAYLSVLSTALLETPDPARTAYLPGLFGLRRPQRVLAGLPFLPARVIATQSELTAFLEEAEVRAPEAPDHPVTTGGASPTEMERIAE